MNSRHVIDAAVQQHNQRAETTVRDVEPIARVVLGVVLAILSTAALVHWATPCADGHQCAGLLLAPAANMRKTLRGSWLHRAWVWPRVAYLRTVIRWAEDEVQDMQDILDNEVRSGPEQRHIAAQIRAHQQWICLRTIEMIDCDLGARAL